MCADKNNQGGSHCRMCRPEVREIAVLLGALSREDFEHLAARVKVAHEAKEEGSILAKLLLAKPVSHPGYAEFEERMREVGEQRRRSGDP